jgi:hypothetical protein
MCIDANTRGGCQWIMNLDGVDGVQEDGHPQLKVSAIYIIRHAKIIIVTLGCICS